MTSVIFWTIFFGLAGTFLGMMGGTWIEILCFQLGGNLVGLGFALGINYFRKLRQKSKVIG